MPLQEDVPGQHLSGHSFITGWSARPDLALYRQLQVNFVIQLCTFLLATEAQHISLRDRGVAGGISKNPQGGPVQTL